VHPGGTGIASESGKPDRAYLIERSRHTLVSSDTGTERRASDAALIERIVQRDQTALAALYDRYAAMLSSVLNRILRDSQTAEEILQDIFFQLWSVPSRFDAARGSLPAWLMVIARNRAISQLRRHNPAAGEPLLETTVVSPFNIESDASQRQLLGRVKGALENLPVEQRAAVELAFFEGLTHSEIAKRTGDPLGTVKTRLRSAVETLKRTLHSAAATT
jgi:RNA polymerase sigma-70 factor (ECF subfamily)